METLVAALAHLVAALLAALPAQPALHDLPRGHTPRVGYVDHGVWVDPDGDRTRLPPTHGVSAIVPYAGGFVLADTRFFEGSVGLWMVRDGEARELPGCSTGSPRLVDGWVWWITSGCPESGDTRRTRIVRARPDGTCLHVRLLPRHIDGDALLDAGRLLRRLAPAPPRVREDARHHLVVAHRRGWTAVVRVGPGGRRELATEPARFDGRTPPYVLGPGR